MARMAYLFLFLGDCPHQRELLQVLWLHEGEIGGQALLVELHAMRNLPGEACGAHLGRLILLPRGGAAAAHSGAPCVRRALGTRTVSAHALSKTPIRLHARGIRYMNNKS